MTNPYISVVIPVYNEAENLRTLYTRLTAVLDKMHKPFEILFTNDGSKDESLTILKALHQERPEQIRVIDFNGNWGQHMAIMAGFERARGDIVVTLDADLQNPPEEIPKLIAAIEAGHDVVGGARKQRIDSAFRRYASKLNNKIRYRITKIQMEDQGSMLRAYRNNIVKLMASSGESTAFIPALAYSLAANPTEIEVEHEARHAGESKYNLYKLMRLNFDLMTGFSLIPLQIFTAVGMLVSLASGLFFVFLILRRLFVGPEAYGLFTLFAILYLLVGIGLLGLGVLGEYIGRIYQEVRKRPRFVIRDVYEKLPTDGAVSKNLEH